MSDIAVRVDGLGKRFTFNLVPNQSLDEAVERRMRWIKGRISWIRKDLSLGRWPRPSRYAPPPREEFWALRDISFELKYGEVLGIVGPNGAGKSTLLKILSQVLTPTTGQAELFGRVGALLEVGTGFNPDLSGRENIFLYGSILGMTRADIAKRFDEIVAFAEIERFLHQPLKFYSTGMHSRLAFSVAAHLECDILLVDEVLSVGDAAFRAKSMGKMQDVTGQGRAVVFVSHNMSAVNNMCDRGIVLKGGQIQFEGAAQDATRFYMEGVSKDTGGEVFNPATFPPKPQNVLTIREVYTKNGSGRYSNEIEYIDTFTVGMKVDVNNSSLDYYNAIGIYDTSGNLVTFTTDEDLGEALISGKAPGLYDFQVTFPARLLQPGEYRLTWATCRKKQGKVDKHENVIPLTIIDTQTWRAEKGLYRRLAMVAPELQWHVEEVATSAQAPAIEQSSLRRQGVAVNG